MIPLKITLIEDPPFEGSKRALAEFKRHAFEAAGRCWFVEILPKHFTRAARDIYHHQARSRKYLSKKHWLASKGRAKYGGNVDNVLSGQSEAAIRGSAAVRAFPTRFSVTMPSPSYFTMRPYKSNQPNKGEETTRVTPDEMKRLIAVAEQDLEKSLRGYRFKKTTHY